MPNSPIDIYLQAIERELRVHLGGREASKVLAEVETHLLERSEALVELGSAPQNAQLEAVLGFGMPWEIASQYAAVPVKRRMPDWAGEAVIAVGVAGASLGLHFSDNYSAYPLTVYPFIFCAYFGAVFNRRFPWIGLALSMWISWWYVMSGPEQGIYPGRIQANLQAGFYSVVGSFLVGVVLRWLFRQVVLLVRRRVHV